MKLPGKALRLVMPLATLWLAAGLLMAASPAASAATSGPSKAAAGWVRCAHLSPNSPKVDVYLYSFNAKMAPMVLKGVGYGDVSAYMAFPAGFYTVAMRPAGAPSSSSPILSTSINVAPGAAYTVAGMGPASGLRLQVIPDRLTSAPGEALVRVIQASLQEHKVTVTDGARVLASGLPFATVTSYRTIAPGSQTVQVAGGTVKTAQAVTLSANTIHTLVVLDTPGGLRIDSLEDAAGSHIMPAGGAATGLGGTAVPTRGASPVPWLVSLAGGALLAVAGVLRLRRIRGGVVS
jgi:uncharacterized protein DUF4397